jgi:hypothetical protein
MKRWNDPQFKRAYGVLDLDFAYRRDLSHCSCEGEELTDCMCYVHIGHRSDDPIMIQNGLGFKTELNFEAD